MLHISSYTEAITKWLTFRRHFQTHFLDRKFLYHIHIHTSKNKIDLTFAYSIFKIMFLKEKIHHIFTHKGMNTMGDIFQTFAQAFS